MAAYDPKHAIRGALLSAYSDALQPVSSRLMDLTRQIDLVLKERSAEKTAPGKQGGSH